MTEDIGNAGIAVGAALYGFTSTEGGAIAVDVYEGDIPAKQTVQKSYYSPNEDCFGWNAKSVLASGSSYATIVDNVHGQGGGFLAATQAFQEVDEHPITQPTWSPFADFILLRSFNPLWFHYRCRFDIPTGDLDGKRIVNVAPNAQVWNFYNGAGGTAAFATGLFNGPNVQTTSPPNVDNVTLKQWPIIGATPMRGTYSAVTLPYNPFTDLPWQISDVMQLKGTTTPFVASAHAGLQAHFAGVMNWPGNPIISQVFLVVEWVPENRVATGAGLIAQGGVSGSVPLLLSNPAGTGPWKKVAGRDYTVVVRRMDTNAYLSLNPASQPTTLNVSLLRGAQCATRLGTRQVTVGNPAGDPVSAGPLEPESTTSLVLYRGSSISDDSQVYPLRIIRQLVDAVGLSAQQDYTPTAGVPYGSVRVVAAYLGGAQPPSTLTASLRLRSSGALLTSGTLDPASNPYRDKLATGPTPVGITFTTPWTAPSASQVYIEFTGTGWLVFGLHDGTGAGSTQNWGGGVDNEWFGGVEHPQIDLCATIGVSPSKPTLTSVVV